MIRVRCPICDASMQGQSRGRMAAVSPSAAARCRLIDLGRWLGESIEFHRRPEGRRPRPTKTRNPLKPTRPSAVPIEKARVVRASLFY